MTDITLEEFDLYDPHTIILTMPFQIDPTNPHNITSKTIP